MSVVKHISEIDGVMSRRGNPMREKKKKEDISCSSINRGAREIIVMITVVRSKRCDTSHLVSYINLPGHISSPLIAFKSTSILINFTSFFFF